MHIFTTFIIMSSVRLIYMLDIIDTFFKILYIKIYSTAIISMILSYYEYGQNAYFVYVLINR